LMFLKLKAAVCTVGWVSMLKLVLFL
jgi:hypothetical protein